MDSVTRQMLEKIRGEIVKLQQLELSIVEQFSSSSEEVDGTPRKIVIHEWLKKHGPASRGEILAGTRLPQGTIGAYLSTEKDLFERRDRKWVARKLRGIGDDAGPDTKFDGLSEPR